MVTKQEVDTMALGVASFLAGFEMLRGLEPHRSEEDAAIAAEIIRSLDIDGTGQPMTPVEIYKRAADVVIENRLGWFNRNRFYSSIYFALQNQFGVERSSAQNHVETIQSFVKSRR